MEIDIYGLSTKDLIREWIEEENREQRSYFFGLNAKGGRYSIEQKEFAIERAKSIGFRATSRLLQVPRRTIQRWIKSEGIIIKGSPDWVYDWAYWRRKRKEKYGLYR